MLTHLQKVWLLKLAATVAPFTLPQIAPLRQIPQVKPPIKTPAPQVKPPSTLTPERLYNAIRVPETGGEKNPWIRTRVAPPKGSTAYGPVQLTKTLAMDYKSRFPTLFDKDEHGYLDRFAQQADRFIQFGKEPNKPGYHPRYDYGGSGDLTSPVDQTLYQRVSQKILGKFMEDNPDPSSVVQRWRGESDPTYLQTVLDLLKQE